MMMKKIFFDTEFYEDGERIYPISIGLVTESGMTFYAEYEEFDYSIVPINHFVQSNVLPKLSGKTLPREEIAKAIKTFAGIQPEFWAYYASYDWIVLCQTFGTMMDLPEHFPMFVRDLKVLLDDCKLNPHSLVEKPTNIHNALDDAAWNRSIYQELQRRYLVE